MKICLTIDVTTLTNSFTSFHVIMLSACIYYRCSFVGYSSSTILIINYK